MERKVTAAVKTATVALTALTAAGAGVLAAGIKNAIDAQDEFAKLSKQTGLAVDTLAGLKFAADQSGTSIERVSKATRNFSALVADAANGSTEAASKIKSLGLNVDELLKLNPEERFYKMVGALEKFGAEDQAVALTRVLGDRMAELVPLLSGGEAGLRAMADEGKRLNPVTAESAAQAEKFNDSLDSLQREATQFVQVLTVNLLPALSNIIGDMREAARTGSALDVVMAGLGSTFREVFGKKATSDIAGVRVEIFKVQERIRELQTKRNSALGFLVPQKDIEFEKVKLGELNKQLGELIKANQELQKQPASTNAPKASLIFDEPKAQLETRVKQTRQLVSEEERLAKALQEEGRRLTEQIDPLARKNSEIERYKTLLESGAISEGIYTQAVERSTEDYLRALGFVAKETDAIEDSTKNLGDTTRDVFDSMEQIAIQGVRNIQSSFADGIFNFFDRGMKGMVDSGVTAVGRMASEFASIKLLQAAGGLFGMGGASTAFASGGGGLGGALNLASLGSGASNMFKTGFGATGLVGGGLSALGGSSSLGMFGAGMQGGSAGAAFIAAESATGAGAAGLGASMGAVAGPLIALAVADQIGRLLAGNKSTGTFVDKIPVIGGFASALFGRGPLKQGMTVLKGDIGTEGFESGGINTRFDAKGGLFRSNKTDFAGVDAVTGQINTDNKDLRKYADSIAEASRQIIASINSTVTSTADSLYDLAGNLGISTSGLDDFSTQIKIVSEAGKFLSEEKIAEEVARITKEMALSLLPSLEELGKQGEDVFSTLNRLSSEFSILKNSATILGLSIAESSELIKNMSFESRTAFVDAAGGVDALGQKVSFFAQNFLSAEEQLAPVIESVNGKLSELGLSAITTRDQFKEVVQSYGKVGGITESTLIALLDLAPAFAQITETSSAAAPAIDDLNESIDKTAAILQERESLETRLLQLQGNAAELRRRELEGVDESNRGILQMIFALEDQAAAADEASKALELSTEASEDNRRTLEGNLKDAFGNLSEVVGKEKDKIAAKFEEMMGAIDASIKPIAANISTLESISRALTSTINTARGLSIDDARSQIKSATASVRSGNAIDLDDISGAISALSSRGTQGFSTREEFIRAQSGDIALLDQLNNAVGSQLTVEERTLSELETQRDMLQEQHDAELLQMDKIVAAAREQIDAIMGVDKTLDTLLGAKSKFVSSLASLAASVGAMVREIQDAAGFASGGYHSGGLRIVGERGPELEATGPARIYSAEQTRAMLSGGGVSTSGLELSVNRLTVKMTEMASDIKRTRETLDMVTRGTYLATSA